MSRVLLTSLLALAVAAPALADDKKSALTLVVMDPLALPLSCPCVKGYAQRDYDKLAKFLEKELGRPVAVHFSESLTAALQKKTEGKADIIIGKHSVVESEAKASNLKISPVLSLTGKDGKTTMTGLMVVPAKDPALTAADLKGYRIIFGTADCDEKYAAAFNLLKENAIALPKKPETCSACSDGATKILELFRGGEKCATVISSYAAPLLEGCGTINKGDLRVVGETDPVPFVVAFVNTTTVSDNRVAEALLKMKSVPDLMTALETKGGFVKFETTKKK